MNVDLIIAAPLVLALITGRQREGARPAWTKRIDMIAIPATALLILVGWAAIALSGSAGEWVMRLAYIPMAVMVYTSWAHLDQQS